MKIDQWLREARHTLQNSNIPTSRLDVLVLLEDCTSKNRTWLLAHPEHELTSKELAILEDKIKRRSNHEPLAYIRGKTEFYGLEFMVNNHTLEPRPETETIIELLKTCLKGPTFQVLSPTIVDVGTGSGAIAITAKLEFPDFEVYGTDIDNKCIQTANDNAAKHLVNIDFRQGDLLKPVRQEHLEEWVVLANLPYVPDSHTINEAAMFEPRHAIFGGEDGLDYYRQMFAQTDYFASKPMLILTESLPFQHDELCKIAQTAQYKQYKEQDFIQVFSKI